MGGGEDVRGMNGGGETSDWKLETTAAADGGGDWDDEGRARAGVKSDWRGHGLRQSAAANTNQQQHNVMYVESGALQNSTHVWDGIGHRTIFTQNQL